VGLLAATERSSGGYRLYDEAAVARLRFIDRAKHLGLPLEEIRDLVAVWDGGLCAHVQDRLRAHITIKSVEVRDRIADLTVFAGRRFRIALGLSRGRVPHRREQERREVLEGDGAVDVDPHLSRDGQWIAFRRKDNQIKQSAMCRAP
jgi:DNA-binding transcriptional MerR regulator